MAGLGYKSFSAGDVLTAAQVQGYLQDQAVMRFADSTARASAIGTANFTEGMISYLDNTNQVEYYSGSTWASIAPVSTQGLTLINTTSFSGVTSVSLPAATFSASYANYKLYFSGLIATGAAAVEGRLRVSGSDNATASSYVRQVLLADGSSVNGQRVTATNWDLGGWDTTLVNALEVDLINPFLASPTGMFYRTERSSSSAYFHTGCGTHNQSVSYDSFSLLCANNMTGNVRVYGYNQ
jgi:hypothetical protein